VVGIAKQVSFSKLETAESRSFGGAGKDA
jgi:hypothetical protein